jgi:hypothetical protein
MGGGMAAADGGKPNHGEAQAMLDICASVGATAVDLTLTSSAGEKEWFRRNLPLAELGRMLTAMLDDATAKKRNVIIRPHGPTVTLLQLDDLKAHQLPPAAVVFVTLETSPGNYQAWLALPGKLDKEFASRIRKGAGADIGASGATRIPGRFNFKDDHAPEKTGRPEYPRVTITEARRGQMTTVTELDQLGLVAPKQEFRPLSPARFTNPRKWPSYEIAVDGAPLNKAGTGPSLSHADFVWCMTCSTWGFDEKEIIERLLEESEHARRPENGRPYAERTAKNALGYVERRRQQKRERIASRFRSTYLF